ncbi:uncharacterized protein LOC115211143 [Octopus sinensis]|uniref:Uncharacterized protein LOC115211143 n=1 Tax=Octopus sinensis TaxID=2607531 RepID=A0A7E6FGY0_9MOLL|nr:uncharacterized protein LOC115211143 [Octopus sinensis]
MSEASTLLQSWILDYACRHRFESIIQNISSRNDGHLESLAVCHSRLACSTIYFIVHKEQFSYFDTVIKIIEQLHKDFPSHMINNNIYNRLIIGLKIRYLFNELKCNFNNVLLKLNAYFPRVPANNGNEQLLEKQRNFRKFFLSLIANKSQRKLYLNNEFNSEFGCDFMESIKTLTDKFLSNLETYLMPPVIDLLLASDNFQNLPVLSPETEMLLDFIYDVKNQPNGDEASDGEQEEKTLMFKEQDLLHMLNLLCPLHPEEPPSFDHHIILTRSASDSVSPDEEKPPTCSEQIQPQDSPGEDLQQNEQEPQEFYTLIYISPGEESEDNDNENSTSSLTQEPDKQDLKREIETSSEPLQKPEIEAQSEPLQEPETETYSEVLQTNLKEINNKPVCDLPRKETNLIGSDALVLQSTCSKFSNDEQIVNISVKNCTKPSYSNNYNLQNDLSVDHNFTSEYNIFQSSDSSSDFESNYNFVCPPSSDSEQIFYCGNLFNDDPNYVCDNKQPEKEINAFNSKSFRNEDISTISTPEMTT